MAALYHSLFTEKGLELLRESIQNGTKLGITHMSFGDGNGSLPTPDAKFTKMVNEVYRTALNRLSPSKDNPNWLEADGVIPSAVGGFNIREVGLWAGNDMVAYANYPPTYKPSGDQGTAQIKTIRIVLQIDNTANFELKIDASVVMATVEYVNEKISNIIKYVDTLDDLKKILNPFNKQVVFVNEMSKNYIYNDSSIEQENIITIIGKWEMELQEAYYASMFCPKSSVNNINEPQTENLNLAYRYATSKKRAFIIDQTYYVESKQHNSLNSYPALRGNDSLHYAIRILNNSSLIFSNSSELKLVPNSDNWSRILCIYDIENYLIFDPLLVGDKSQHLSETGEQHLLLACHASKNGYIRNPTLRDSWGDGIYFGYAFYTASNSIDVKYPTNLKIDNLNIYNASRNGLSLCGAEDLFINGLIIDKVDRTAPMAGIDIEPEEDHVYNGGQYMHLKNVRIHNVSIKNCYNYGIISYIYGNRQIDVKFTGITSIQSESPHYCSFPLWHFSGQGDNVESYNAYGLISFEKVIMDDRSAKWEIVSPISFYSANAAIRLSINDLVIENSRNPLLFSFENPTIITSEFNGGLSIKNMELHKDYTHVELGQTASAKKLRFVDLPIPAHLQVEYLFNQFKFENNVNIGGYARLSSKGWYNTDELINHTIFTPQQNPDDNNSIQSRIYDLGQKSNGRTMTYSLESTLTNTQIGDGLYAHCGRLLRSNSPLASITCDFMTNGVRNIKASFGTYTIF